jgi:hypothetical protein
MFSVLHYFISFPLIDHTNHYWDSSLLVLPFTHGLLACLLWWLYKDGIWVRNLSLHDYTQTETNVWANSIFSVLHYFISFPLVDHTNYYWHSSLLMLPFMRGLLACLLWWFYKDGIWVRNLSLHDYTQTETNVWVNSIFNVLLHFISFPLVDHTDCSWESLPILPVTYGFVCYDDFTRTVSEQGAYPRMIIPKLRQMTEQIWLSVYYFISSPWCLIDLTDRAWDSSLAIPVQLVCYDDTYKDGIWVQ